LYIISYIYVHIMHTLDIRTCISFFKMAKRFSYISFLLLIHITYMKIILLFMHSGFFYMYTVINTCKEIIY